MRGTLEHDIHLRAIFVAEVMEANLRAMPADLATHLLKYKGLNKMVNRLYGPAAPPARRNDPTPTIVPSSYWMMALIPPK